MSFDGRLILLLLLFFIEASCGREEVNATSSSSFKTVVVDLSSEGLPLKMDFPVSDTVLGNYRIQVINEMDGYIWQIQKGPNFKFQIEDIGVDTHIFDNKIREILLTDFMKQSLISQSDSMFVFQLKNRYDSQMNSYFILKKVISEKGCFIVSTEEKGVPEKYYARMLESIRSMEGIKSFNE